jgi:hypothetical protein
MDKIDKIDWYKFRANTKPSLKKDEFNLVCLLHAKYFKHKYYKPCTCNPRTIKTWIAQLNDLYEKDNGDE